MPRSSSREPQLPPFIMRPDSWREKIDAGLARREKLVREGRYDEAVAVAQPKGTR